MADEQQGVKESAVDGSASVGLFRVARRRKLVAAINARDLLTVPVMYTAIPDQKWQRCWYPRYIVVILLFGSHSK